MSTTTWRKGPVKRLGIDAARVTCGISEHHRRKAGVGNRDHLHEPKRDSSSTPQSILLGYAELMVDQQSAAEVEKEAAVQVSAPAPVKAPTEADDAWIPLPSRRRLRGKGRWPAPPAVDGENGD